MTLNQVFILLDIAFLVYFLLINSSYLALNLLSNFATVRRMVRFPLEETASPSDIRQEYLQPGVTIVIPAHNEEDIILKTVRSVLNVNYEAFHVLVVNDGSTDATMDLLIDEFDLEPFPDVYRERINTQRVRGFYHSRSHSKLRVIDKENGGKHDALNAAINYGRYPLMGVIDADTLLEPNSLRRVVDPFLRDPDTVGVGGTIRLLNVCEHTEGKVTGIRIPRNPWLLFQMIEYLRAFIFGRVGWSLVNGLFIISGAFGIFDHRKLLEVGGYKNTHANDMDLVVRMHRLMREREEPYWLYSIPEPISWTDVPETFPDLMKQRVVWQKGIADSLAWNRKLLFNRNGGIPGWISYPFHLLFEAAGPVIEVLGYTYMIVGYALGIVSLEVLVLFFWVAVGLGTLHSVVSVLLEEIHFRQFPGLAHIPVLFGVAVLENLGYRQLNSIFRLMGLIKWVTNPQWEPDPPPPRSGQPARTPSQSTAGSKESTSSVS